QPHKGGGRYGGRPAPPVSSSQNAECPCPWRQGPPPAGTPRRNAFFPPANGPGLSPPSAGSPRKPHTPPRSRDSLDSRLRLYRSGKRQRSSISRGIRRSVPARRHRKNINNPCPVSP